MGMLWAGRDSIQSMSTSRETPERRREIARRAAEARWAKRPRVDRETDAVTMTKPLCLRCRGQIGFDEGSGPAVIEGLGWVCWRCVRALWMAERARIPTLGEVIASPRAPAPG